MSFCGHEISAFTLASGWGFASITRMKLIARSLMAMLSLTAAANLIAADKPVGTSADFKGPVGLQLYSLRAEFTAKGVPPTLKQVKGYGFQIVETAGTYNMPAEKFKGLLDEAGLKPVSGHFPFEKYRDDVEGVAKDAKALGLEYAGCAWIPHKDSFDEAEARAAIAVFNKAGEALKKHGIKFFYHIHGYEFHKHGDGTLMDLLMKETKPEFVAFEMDVYWVVHPGQDPVKLLNQYGNRWQLMHIKDKRKGVTGDLTGKSDVKNDVTVGTGQMNWPAILKAAQKAGVKYYFIEDESPVVNDQIAPSLKYLETVKF